MKVFTVALGFLAATVVSASPLHAPKAKLVASKSYERVPGIEGVETADIPVVN